MQIDGVFSSKVPEGPLKTENNFYGLQIPKCENTDLFLRLLNMLMDLLNENSLEFDRALYVLTLMKEFLSNAPNGTETAEMKTKVKNFETRIHKNPHKTNLRGLFDANTKILTTQIVFKESVPNINGKSCQNTLASLIHNAYTSYLKLAISPTCQLSQYYDLNKFLDQTRPEDLPFEIRVIGNDDLSDKSQINKDLDILVANLNPLNPSNDLMKYLQTQGLNKNPDIMSILQNYRPGQIGLPNPKDLTNPDSQTMNPFYQYNSNNPTPGSMAPDVPGLQIEDLTKTLTPYKYGLPEDGKNIYNLLNNNNYYNRVSGNQNAGNLNLPENIWKPPVNILLDDLYKQAGKNSSSILDEIIHSLQKEHDLTLSPQYPFDNLPASHPDHNPLDILNKTYDRHPNLKDILFLINKYLPDDSPQKLSTIDKLVDLFSKDMKQKHYPTLENNPNQKFTPENLKELTNLLDFPKQDGSQIPPTDPNYILNHLLHFFPNGSSQIDPSKNVPPDVDHPIDGRPNSPTWPLDLLNNPNFRPKLIPGIPNNQPIKNIDSNLPHKKILENFIDMLPKGQITPESLLQGTNALPSQLNNILVQILQLLPKDPNNPMLPKQPIIPPYPELPNLEGTPNQNQLPFITGSSQENLLKYLTELLKHKDVNPPNVPNLFGNNINLQNLYGNKLLTPDLKRLMAVSNLLKLNSAPNKAGVIELTYLLKRHSPVIYQPYYYVKYRLPYLSFINNLYKLISKNSALRSNPLNLYQSLLSISNVTEVSPDLQGIHKNEIMNLVINNGALVNAKILTENDALVTEYLKIARDLNSDLKPEEILDLQKKLKDIPHDNAIFEDNTRKLDVVSDEVDKTGLDLNLPDPKLYTPGSSWKLSNNIANRLRSMIKDQPMFELRRKPSLG